MRLLATGLLLAYILSLPCVASTDKELPGQQPENMAVWINWLPAGWKEDLASKTLASELAEGTERGELPQKLHDWICDNIYYDVDAQALGTYSTLSPADVLQERRGVCEAIANLTQSLFLSANIPCIKVWGAAILAEDNWDITEVDPHRINHTWNEYYMDGHWIPLDCTMDMGNTYSNGNYNSAAHRNDYLHPEETFFAKTHIALLREETPPENIPDGWTMTELTQAVESGTVPVGLLENYRQPITKEEFRLLMNCPVDGDGTLNRIESAAVLAQSIDMTGVQTIPYQDVKGCSEAERQALTILYQLGIMCGDGKNFYPMKALTRQEAILLANRMWKWREAMCI